MKRKVLSVILTVLLIAANIPSLCFSAFAEEMIEYGVIVVGVRVTSENAADVLNDGAVSYVPATDDALAKLTLNNAALRNEFTAPSSSYKTLLWTEEDLEIEILGTNTVNSFESTVLSEASFSAIYCKSSAQYLHFTGNGTINIVTRAVASDRDTYGIKCGSLTVGDSVKLNVSTTDIGKKVYAVSAANVTLEDNSETKTVAGGTPYTRIATVSTSTTAAFYVNDDGVFTVKDNAYAEFESRIDSVPAFEFYNMAYYGGTVCAYGTGYGFSCNHLAKANIYTDTMVCEYSETVHTKLIQGEKRIIKDRSDAETVGFLTNYRLTSLRIEQAYPVTILGVPVTDGNKTDFFGDGTVSYTPATENSNAVLSLDNASVAASGTTGISIREPLDILVTGNCSVTNTVNNHYTAISSTEDINISGTGTLTLNTDDFSVIPVQSGMARLNQLALNAAKKLTVIGDVTLNAFAYAPFSLNVAGATIYSSMLAKDYEFSDNVTVNIENVYAGRTALCLPADTSLTVSENATVNISADNVALDAFAGSSIILEDNAAININSTCYNKNIGTVSVGDLMLSDDAEFNLTGSAQKGVVVNGVVELNDRSSVNIKALDVGLSVSSDALVTVNGEAEFTCTGSKTGIALEDGASFVFNSGKMDVTGSSNVIGSTNTISLSNGADVLVSDSTDGTLADWDTITPLDNYRHLLVKNMPLIYVGDVRVTGMNKNDYRDTEGWYFVSAANGESAKLYLTNASISKISTKNAMIYSEVDLEIIVAGNNVLSYDGFANIKGIQCDGDLTISGDPSSYPRALSVDVGSGNSDGIYSAGDLTVEEVTELDVKANNRCFYAGGKFTGTDVSEISVSKQTEDGKGSAIKAGSLEFCRVNMSYTAKEDDTNGFRYGIYVDYDADFEATAINFYGCAEDGVCVNGDMTVSDSAIYIRSYGASGSALFTGGDLDVTEWSMLDCSSESNALCARVGGDLTVTDADFYVSGGELGTDGMNVLTVVGNIDLSAEDYASLIVYTYSDGVLCSGNVTLGANTKIQVNKTGDAESDYGMYCYGDISVAGEYCSFNMSCSNNCAAAVICTSFNSSDGAVTGIYGGECALKCLDTLTAENSTINLYTELLESPLEKYDAALEIDNIYTDKNVRLSIDSKGYSNAISYRDVCALGEGIYTLKSKNGAVSSTFFMPENALFLRYSESYDYLQRPQTSSLPFDVSEYKYAQFECGLGLMVNGEEVSSENLSGEGWSYDCDTRTLTLENAELRNISKLEYSGFDYDEGLPTEENIKGSIINTGINGLKINLAGENVISISEELEKYSNFYGVCATVPTQIGGDGSLFINVSAEYSEYGNEDRFDSDVSGILAYSLVLEDNAQVEISVTGEGHEADFFFGGEIKDNACLTVSDDGSYASGSILMSGGSLVIEGEDPYSQLVDVYLTFADDYYPLYLAKASADDTTETRVMFDENMPEYNYLKIRCGNMPGDVAENGEVDVLDYQALVNTALGKTELTGDAFYAGDLEFDNVIDVLDCAILERMISALTRA